MNQGDQISRTEVRAVQLADRVLELGGCGTLAVKQLGFADGDDAARQAFVRLSQTETYRQRLRERLDHAFSLPVAEPIGLFVQQMRASIGDFIDDDGRLVISEVRKNGHLVKKIKVKRYFKGEDDPGQVEEAEIELYSSQTAASNLCDILQLKNAKAEPGNGNTFNFIIIGEKVENSLITLMQAHGIDRETALAVYSQVAPEQVKLLEGVEGEK